MQVRDLLINRKNDITAEVEKLQAELAEIDRMLSVSDAAPQPQGRVQQANGADDGETVLATKDDAILDAVRNGNRSPATISNYIREKLGVDVNDASTRTRLSRMKAAGKIGHDAFGWKIEKK